MKSTFASIVALFLGCQLQAQVVFKLSTSPDVSGDPNMVAVADVNGDGKKDLICVQYFGPSVTVLTNNGSNNFILSGMYSVGNLPYAVVAADVNRDGKMDIITANSASGDNSLSVLTNNGSGGFVLSGTYSVGTEPIWVTAADVNGDTNVDLISANWASLQRKHTDGVDEQRQRWICACLLASDRHLALFGGGSGCQWRRQNGFDQRQCAR